MPFITANDGTQLYWRDWGSGAPMLFVSALGCGGSMWDYQFTEFGARGMRCLSLDRRGHGRSSQTSGGHDMDHYAADVMDLVSALDLRGAIHVGHSTGGGEVVHYVARAEPGRVSKAAIISAVPPVMVKKESNPGGTPIEAFDGYRAALAANRSQLYIDIASGPFYNFNRPGVATIQGCVDNWWRQGMMGAANAHYDCIKAFSETDFTEDLKAIDVPVLVMHSEDDQIVPYADSGPLAAKLLKRSTFKSYKELPHGMMTTHPDLVNAELLAFIREGESSTESLIVATPTTA